MTTSLRLGVIEVGSRAIRLLVGDYSPEDGIRVATTDYAENKLALALQGGVEVQQHTLAAMALVVSNYLERCRSLHATHICVFGTEALRRLSPVQLAQLQERIPDLIVMDPAREAECSLLAAARGTQGGNFKGTVLVIDQGAASMELALGTFTARKLKLKATSSYPLGTQPLVEWLNRCDGNLHRFSAELESHVATLHLMPSGTAVRSMLMGSAATKLAWISVRQRAEDRYDPRLVHGTEMTVDKIDQLIEIAEYKPDFLRTVIDPRRPDSSEFETVIAGLLALSLVLKQLNSVSFTVSAFGTRHGVAWQLIEAAQKAK